MHLFERINLIARELAKSQARLGKAIGVNPRTFQGYLSLARENNLWPLLPRVLEAYPEVRREWLYFGEGEVRASGVAADRPSAEEHAVREARVERLKRFMRVMSLPRAKLAEVGGITVLEVSGYLAGDSPGAEALARWSAAFDLSVDWLLTGAGEMLRSEIVSEPRRRELEFLKNERDRLMHELVEVQRETIKSLHDALDARPTVAREPGRGSGHTMHEPSPSPAPLRTENVLPDNGKKKRTP